jgi:hypothetical protein
MTTRTLATKDSASASSIAAVIAAPEAAQVPTDLRQSRLLEAMKSQYRLDQQEKFLHLQAETESLLQQLQALKQQRLSASEP